MWSAKRCSRHTCHAPNCHDDSSGGDLHTERSCGRGEQVSWAWATLARRTSDRNRKGSMESCSHSHIQRDSDCNTAWCERRNGRSCLEKKRSAKKKKEEREKGGKKASAEAQRLTRRAREGRQAPRPPVAKLSGRSAGYRTPDFGSCGSPG